ncbi:MAG: histone protein [Candidatus Moranbacteria bacterium GW2011_GWD2_38_7]|nr:MAG: histone protein [Candidatus Moranbacteria bacterium GW2011_GWD2_38_7]
MQTKKTSSKKVAAKKIEKKAAVKKTVTKKVVAKKAVVAKKVTKKSPAKVLKRKTMPAVKKVVEARKTGRRRPSIKRVVYMILSIILGILLGTFVQSFVELVYVKKALMGVGMMQTNYFLGMPSYLPMFVSVIFLLCGLAFGIWLGFWGWRFVYIEHRHRART